MGFHNSKKGYAIPLAVMPSPPTRSVFMTLCFRADDQTFECWPGNGDIRRCTGLAPSTIWKSLEWLCTRQFVIREPGTARASNTYVINWEVIDAAGAGVFPSVVQQMDIRQADTHTSVTRTEESDSRTVASSTRRLIRPPAGRKQSTEQSGTDGTGSLEESTSPTRPARRVGKASNTRSRTRTFEKDTAPGLALEFKHLAYQGSPSLPAGAVNVDALRGQMHKWMHPSGGEQPVTPTEVRAAMEHFFTTPGGSHDWRRFISDFPRLLERSRARSTDGSVTKRYLSPYRSEAPSEG